MTIRIFSKAALAGFALVIAQSASAATFDFVSMADNPGDANYILGSELNWQDTTFSSGLTIGGIELDASGSNVNNKSADAFFDKGTAGLGVCSTAGPSGGGSGCATNIGSDTSDDNVSGSQGGETLTLDFNQTVGLFDLFFRNSSHGAMNGSLTVNGGLLTVVAGLVTGGSNFLAGSAVYNFKYTGDQFYLSTVSVSAVPLPAAGLLLFGALGGLGAIGRRRRRG
jgi:hypothetical protein